MRYVCLLLAGTLGFAQTVQIPNPNPSPLSAPSTAYRIAPGDVLELKFYYNPDLNVEVTVRPDGAISAVLAGDVVSAGETPAALSKKLEKLYAAHLRNPEVTVVVKEFSGQKIFVGGEVMGPRALELRGSMTCMQAIMSAGGPRSSAKLSEALLLRYQGDGKAEVRRVDLAKVMKGQADDVALQPYDVLVLPKRRIAQVGQFVDEYVNAMVPRSLFFPYNLNNTISYNVN
jgi:protein involved in polysaccharide export with SLBB domain